MNTKKFLITTIALCSLTACNNNNEILSNQPTSQPSITQQPITQRGANYIRTVPQEGVQTFSADILPETTDTLVVVKFSYPGLALSRTLRFDMEKQILTEIPEDGRHTFEPEIVKANLRLSKKADGKIHLEGDAIFDETIYPNLWVIDEIDAKVVNEELEPDAD